jgi:hypothetical protein
MIKFSSHVAKVGVCEIPPKVCDCSLDPLVASGLEDKLDLGLDLEPSKKFKAEVRSRYHSTVHPLGKSNHFLLLVSFGRSKFRLDSVSVALALVACLGGSSKDFNVISCG